MSVENGHIGYMSYKFERPSPQGLSNFHLSSETYFTDFPCADVNRDTGVAYVIVSSSNEEALQAREVLLQKTYGLSGIFTGLSGRPEIATRADPQKEWNEWKFLK